MTSELSPITNCHDRLLEALSLAPGTTQNPGAQLLPHCQRRAINAGGYLLNAGQMADSVFFLCSGLVRFFYLTEDGREHNKSFACEGQVAGGLLDATQSQPSRFSIQALEPVQAVVIPLAMLEQLCDESLV